MSGCRYDRVVLMGFEWYEPSTIAFLERIVPKVLHIPAVFGQNLPLPSHAFNTLRKQYLASAFLEELLLYKQRPKDILLGVTGVDLFEPNLNFVFGVAVPYGVAVISTVRLHNEFYGLSKDKKLYLKRVATEAIHEIGHTLGLGHCPDPHCVMHFSNSLADTDKKGYRFCPKCWSKAKQVLCIGDGSQ